MKRSFLFALLLLPAFAFTQVKKVKAKIVYTGALFSTYDFDADAKSLKSAIKTQGCTSLLADIINYSFETNWPSDISTFDSRDNHRTDMKDYNVYKIVATSDVCILMVPASENRHMSATMRPERDIYFIMELKGANYDGNANVNVDETAGASDDWDEFADYMADDEEEDEEASTVRIVDPGELFSTYDLAADAVAREKLVDSGVLDEEQFATLCKMVVEDYWPSGIKALDDRLAKAETMKLYHAVFGASFESDGNSVVLVWVPKEGNEHMPYNMQPTDENGFYMIFRSNGVVIE